jgi:CheY-like chemotaxis protein
MTKTAVLVADNDVDFLETRAEFLEREGYHVVQAADFTQARRLLEQGGIGAAILDVRLENDDDDKDTSGLTLAEEVARSVPKIILTGYPSVAAVRRALHSQPDGHPAAVAFVAKREGPEALLKALRDTLTTRLPATARTPESSLPSVREIESRIAPVSFPIATQLLKDYKEIRKEVTFIYRARLLCAVIGAIVILGGSVGAGCRLGQCRFRDRCRGFGGLVHRHGKRCLQTDGSVP